MLDRHSRQTTDTTRRATRPLALGFALALACASGAVAAQTPATSATAAAPQPAQPNAQAAPKPGAAKNARARRVAPTTPKPAAPAQASTPKVGVKPEAAAVDESQNSARPSAESSPEAGPEGGEPKAVAKKAGAGVGASGVEAELNDLRMRIKDARPEERGRLQRALADRLVALDRKADALDELRRMIHEDRFDPAFFYNTGNALARLGDANAAADAYRKAVSQRRGNYSRALNNLGVVLTRQGRWDEAHEVFVSALTQENFTYAEASYNLGRLHLLRGQTDLALREWARTLRLQPDHTEAAAALARAYAEDGDSERALALLESFTARAARAGGAVPGEIAYARTAIVESRGRADGDGGAKDSGAGVAATRAAAATSAARDSRPGAARASGPLRSLNVDRVTYNALETARAASEHGRHEEAVRHYRTVLSRRGGYLPPANLELSFALITLGRDAEAAASLQSLVERDGARYPVAHYHLARLHERAGRNAPAAEHFARAAALYGDTNPQVLLDLSRTREKLGDTRGALEAVESYAGAISRQGSVPHWVVERADALRMKAKTTKP
ncbi:MAG: tetratricopeptide repeat protein [Acidobacteria bacterium]|nr:tetratricopeptide repeat protein [Acidobacteriota bacterium]